MLRCAIPSWYAAGTPNNRKAMRASLPRATDQQQQEKCKTERAPVDEWFRAVENAGRWNQRCADEINEIPGESFWRARQKLAIENRSGNQQNADHHRGKMKTDDPGYVFGRRRVIGHVVRSHPVFIAPNITQ